MSVKWVPGLIITSSNLKAKLKYSFTEEAEMNLYKVYNLSTCAQVSRPPIFMDF